MFQIRVNLKYVAIIPNENSDSNERLTLNKFEKEVPGDFRSPRTL
jgi:hypothetical protein